MTLTFEHDCANV